MLNPLGRLATCLCLVSGALAGCTTIEQRLPAGTPARAVTAAMGQPTLTCPLPDGGQREVWSGQPGSQASWATDVAPDGTTSGVQQVLTDAAFNRLHSGQWDQQRVRCTFGPPAHTGRVGLPGHTQLVWSYAYRQDGVWNSLMHVHFDAAGLVSRAYPGPDPSYDPDRFLMPGF